MLGWFKFIEGIPLGVIMSIRGNGELYELRKQKLKSSQVKLFQHLVTAETFPNEVQRKLIWVMLSWVEFIEEIKLGGRLQSTGRSAKEFAYSKSSSRVKLNCSHIWLPWKRLRLKYSWMLSLIMLSKVGLAEGIKLGRGNRRHRVTVETSPARFHGNLAPVRCFHGNLQG